MEEKLYIIYDKLEDTILFSSFNESKVVNKMIESEDKKRLILLKIDRDRLLGFTTHLCYDLNRNRVLSASKNINMIYKYIATWAMRGYPFNNTRIITIRKCDII